MKLSIMLSKEVANFEEGKQIYELVKLKLVDRPEIKASGKIIDQVDLKNPEP